MPTLTVPKTIGGFHGVPGTVIPPTWTADSPIYAPIPANPVIDPESNAIMAQIAAGTSKSVQIAEFGVPIKVANRNTPRWNLVPTQTGNWGDGTNPFAGYTVPIDMSWITVPAADGHLAIWDPLANLYFDLWKADLSGAAPTCEWGSIQTAGTSKITAEGYGTATAAAFARAAGVITEEDIARGVIDHALVFSSDVCRPKSQGLPGYRFPATHTDGRVVRTGTVDLAATIVQGSRVQLNPSFDVDGQTGWRPYHKMIAKAFQTYGGYCIDNGGAAISVSAQMPDTAFWNLDSTGAKTTLQTGSWDYYNAGLTETFRSIALFPWATEFRILRQWDGG